MLIQIDNLLKIELKLAFLIGRMQNFERLKTRQRQSRLVSVDDGPNDFLIRSSHETKLKVARLAVPVSFRCHADDCYSFCPVLSHVQKWAVVNNEHWLTFDASERDSVRPVGHSADNKAN